MPEEEKQIETAEEETAVQEKESKPEKKKKTKKDSETELLKQEVEHQKELLIRTAAEFDNYKKRTERERSGVAEFAKSAVIKELLPILDNIDRAAKTDPESADYVKGIEMIVKQFLGLKDKLGIEEIAAVGDAFDPNLHEAVMHIEDENLGENVIAQVLQKGYKLGDTIIRAAMVQVAN